MKRSEERKKEGRKEEREGGRKVIRERDKEGKIVKGIEGEVGRKKVRVREVGQDVRKERKYGLMES